MAEKKNWRDAYKENNANSGKAGSWRSAYEDDTFAAAGANIADRVNTFLKNHNTYINNYRYRTYGRKYDYSDDYVRDPNDWLMKVSEQKKAFDTEANNILAYMDRYKGYLDAEWIKSVQDALSGARAEQDIVVGNASDDSKWWSNFANEDEYKTAQRYDGYNKKYSGMSGEEIRDAWLSLSDGEEKSWLSSSSGRLERERLSSSVDDFNEKSKYVNNVVYGLLGKPEFTDDTYAYVNNPVVEDKRWLGMGEATARELIESDRSAYTRDTPVRNYESTFNRANLERMNEDEVAIYNYYYATEGAEKANEYLDYIARTLDYRQNEELIRSVSEASKDHPFLSSLASIGTSLGSGFEHIGNLIEYGADKLAGKDAFIRRNQNASATSAVRGTVSEMVDWEIGNFDAFDFVYNTAMSGADSVASMAFGGLGGTVLGLSAAASATNDALSRGMSDKKAFWNGLASGVAEGLFETWSISKFRALKEIEPETVKDIFKNIGKSMITNASEEFLTEIANIGYDTLVNGEFANITLEELGNGGWSKVFAQALEAAASGALMGIGMGGAASTHSYFKANATALNQYGEFTDDLINEGLESDQNSESYRLAQEYQKQVQGTDGQNGTALTGKQIRNLVKANDEQIFKETRNEAKDKLKALGENASEVWPIAELVAKKVTGQELTRAEKRKLVNSFGSQVAHDMENPTVETQSGTRAYNATYKSITERTGEKRQYNVAEDGKAKVQESGNAFDLSKAAVTDIKKDKKTGKVTDVTFMADGKEVQASGIKFSDESQSFLVEAVSNMENITPKDATALIHDVVDTSKPLGEQLNGIDQAFNYGFWDYSVNDLQSGEFVGSLSTQQMMSAYALGKAARRDSNLAKDAPVVKMRTAWEAKMSAEQKAAQQKSNFESDDVQVYFLDKNSGATTKFDGNIDKYEDNKAATIRATQILSKMRIGGSGYYLYESYVGADGVRYYKDENGVEKKAPHGLYREADGRIYIDLNAGEQGQGVGLFTLSHELTHFVKHKSEAQFKKLGDLVTEAYGKTDKSMDQRVLEKQAELKEVRGGKDVSYTEAYEEVLCDALSTMISDGNFFEKVAEIKVKDKGLFNTMKRFFQEMFAKFKRAYEKLTPDQQDAIDIRQMKDMFDRIQTAFAEAVVEASDNFQAQQEMGAEMSNEEAFMDSETAIHNQIRPPYTDGSKAFDQFVEELNPEARKTFDLFYGFYQKSRITNTLSVSGKKVKAVNISSLYLLADEWNDMLSREQKWADAAKALADFLPDNVRKRMNMNEDGSLNPTMLEKEFKMPSSMAQRLVDALAYEKIDATYQLGNKTITLPTVESRQSVGGEAYRRAIIDETRKLFAEGKLKKVGIGTMSKDRWGSLGFLAANGKTGASGDFTTVCPQMMFNRGCWYCYRRAAMEKGVNNKLVANSVWYTGEILRIKDSDIEALNRNGGLRIQSFGDWMPHFSAMLADVLYDAELRGLQVKIITKEPSMINYIAALREQGIGKNLYFNLSADYTIERGPAKQAMSPDSLDTVNPERPYLRNTDNGFWWKRAMTVEEANKYRQKYPWVNTRIVATTLDEFIRGLQDSRVDVVTGYHGNIREFERVDSTTGEHKVNVEALGDAGMPRFAFNPATGKWVTEYEGKTQTHKRLAQAIAENNLQMEYYTKTCCITGRCATCEGKCGALARDFNVKNATNRDAESVAYWQKQMQYAIEPEFGDMTVDEDVKYSERVSNKELAQADDTALYIKNTDMADYIGMIFNGAKTEETRSSRTLDAFIGKDFYVTDGKYVYGSIVLGEPHQYTEAEFHQKKNQLKHRVPVGDEYDIKPGGTKWAYPIESYKKFDKPKKLSDSKEYKNSFQARQVRYSERTNGIEKPTDNKYIKMVEEGATHIGEYDVVPKSKEPKKTILAWKALVVKPGAKNNPKDKSYGNMYPPQVHQVASTPYGVWLYANEAPKKLDKDGNPVLTKFGRPKVKEGMTYRPAWHFGDAPYASQFKSHAHGFFDDNGVQRFYMSESKGILVWALCEMAADENYQDEADMAGHVGEDRNWDEQQASLWYLPENGYYKYMTNRVDPNSVTWYLSDKMRIVQTITDAEMRDILTWIKEDGSTDLEFNYPLRLDGKDVDPADYGIPVGNVVGDGIDYVDRWKNQFREIAMNGDIDITQSHFYYVPSTATSYGSYETVSFSKEVDDHSQELLKTKKDANILFANPNSNSVTTRNFETSTGIKVKEAKTLAGRKKIIEAAKAEGYDIVEFTKVGKNLGADVVIVNPDAVIRSYKFNNVSERRGKTDAVKYSDRIDTSGMDEDAKEIIRNLKLDRMGSKYGYGVHKYASYTADRISREISDSMAKGVPDYAHAYIAWIDPEDFLRATTTTQEYYERIKSEAGDLDHQKLMNETQPIYLRIDGKTNEILGHEGRHRISALGKAGYDRVAVIVKVAKRDLYSGLLFPERHMKLKGQEFEHWGNGGRVGTRKGADFWVSNMLPLSEKYADAARKLFSEVDGSIKFSERTGHSVSNRALLANAFEGLSQNSNEYKLIQRYKGYVAELNSLEDKLSEFRHEISKLRFGKDEERDAQKLARLENEAKKIAEAINKHDKEILSLEASEPLRKVIEHERKKEIEKTRAHVKEIQQNKKVRAEQAELRHKIRKTIRDLDKILKHGNKQKNVKEDLQPVVTKALKAADILFTDSYSTYDMLRNGLGVDLSDSEEALVKTCTQMLKDIDKMPTDGYDNWQARQEAESKLSAKMSKLKDVFARERKRLNNTTVSSILGELADAYKSLEESEQSYVKGAYMEPVYEFLKNLQSEVGGAIVQDMTKAQLESVYAAYKMVLTTVRKANELFNKDIKMSREQLGNAVINEVMAAGGTHGLWTKGEIARSRASWNNMKPIWVANRIGSESFGKLMQGLFEGQYNFAVDIDEAKRFKLDMDKKYKPRSWDKDKLYEFESSTGRKFSLNLQQIMSLYAFSKREQAYSHLLSGGFVYEANSTVVVDKNGIKRTYLHDGATSYKLNEATLNEIIGTLTAEQKAYVDEMQAYLSDVMGAKGNEVSMKLYGIQLFKEKFYFPLRSSGAYMERAKEAEMKKQQGQINLVNSGFTHAVKPQAKNPIILSGFMDVWAEHCNEMSMYHSMVLPMEDFRKVYNYSTVHDESYDSASVYQSIQDAYGKAATDYIDQLYRELNAGATVDPRETPFKAFISKFKKAAVMMSASVVVQQFSAVGRAYAVIDPKYFIGAKVDSETKLSAADEMKKYAPVAIIKEMGGFDTGTKGSAKSYIMAEAYGKGERLKGLKTDEQYRSDLMGFMPAKADEITWCAIWEAVKRETKAKHSKMDVKSEEFLKLAGERFSEVIEKTQVYDSVLARSANMRSKSAFMNMATAFMAEPTTTINLLEDALRGRSTKKIARAFGAVAVSIVLNNALASVVYAMRDDDEDETLLEKYFQSFTSGMIDDLNPMSYYPFYKDVYSLFQGYDVERADMSVIADLRDALKKAVSVMGKDTDSMNEEQLAEHYKSVNEILLNLLDAGCSAFGVPMKNVRRDVNGMINAYTTISKDVTERDNSWLSFWDKVGSAAKDTIPVLAWTKDTAKADKLYDAIISGDKAYLARLKSGYKTDDAYHTAVRKALRENDPRIQEAANAKYTGNTNEYKRIFKEIQNEGKFSFDDIMSAINTELSKLSPDKATSEYTASGYVEAIALGNMSNAQVMKDDIIATKMANGQTEAEAEKAFASDVATGIKNAYSAGLLNEARAEEMLVEYAGKGEEDAAAKVGYWAFMEKNPKYKDVLTEVNVEYFHEVAEPAGISLDVFVQYLEGTKGLATKYDAWGDVEVTKEEQVLAVIDSLPLTWQQKDALYLAAGYSEDKIWDVPW